MRITFDSTDRQRHKRLLEEAFFGLHMSVNLFNAPSSKISRLGPSRDAASAILALFP